MVAGLGLRKTNLRGPVVKYPGYKNYHFSGAPAAKGAGCGRYFTTGHRPQPRYMLNTQQPGRRGQPVRTGCSSGTACRLLLGRQGPQAAIL